MLRSKEFDDVYFSAEDGLAETRHVFLDGNDLPQSWVGCERFVIGETGFGTGLNFLAALKLFEETAGESATLDFVSVEKYPLRVEDIRGALGVWDELSDYVGRLCVVYHTDGEVLDVALSERARLQVYFGDANDVMADWNAEVDAWFLDGFRPSSNPEMWSEAVFENMARLSRSGTSFATFTSAGFVRRRLEAAGFAVRKVAGFGRKREMSVGVFK